MLPLLLILLITDAEATKITDVVVFSRILLKKVIIWFALPTDKVTARLLQVVGVDSTNKITPSPTSGKLAIVVAAQAGAVMIPTKTGSRKKRAWTSHGHQKPRA